MSDNTRNWTDQPVQLEGLKVLASIHIKIGIAEVRKGAAGGAYYLTVGNLFRSETVLLPDAESALVLLGAVSQRKGTEKTPLHLPEGATVL